MTARGSPQQQSSPVVTFALDEAFAADEMSFGTPRNEHTSYRDSASRKLRTGRRQNRYINNAQLDSGYSSFSDTDPEGDDERDLLYEFEWHSAFAELCEHPQLCDQWREITEEHQLEILVDCQATSLPSSSCLPHGKNGRRPHLSKDMKRDLRKYLGTDFLNYLSTELLAFCKHCLKSEAIDFVPTQKHSSNLYSIVEANSLSLQLTFQDSHYRRLFHGLCSFYGLHSRSKTLASGMRVVTVKKPKANQSSDHVFSLPSISLEQYLSRSQKKKQQA